MTIEGSGPIHYEDLVRIPVKAKPGKEGLAALFAAQYLAHSRDFREACRRLPRATTREAREEGQRILHASIADNLPVMSAAWTAAAALMGWAPDRIWEADAEGDGQTQDECCWEWLFAVLDVDTDGEEQAIYDRLTWRRPEPTPPPPGQLVIDFDKEEAAA